MLYKSSNATEKNKNILFATQRPSDYVEMCRVAQALKPKGYNIYFLYHCLSTDLRYDGDTVKELQQLEASGIFEKSIIFHAGWYSKRSKEEKKLENYENRKKRFKFIKNICCSIIFKIINQLALLFHYFSIGFHFNKAFTEYNIILKKYNINIIILPEDVVGIVTPTIIKVGHDNNIPSLILPYTIANQQEAFKSLSNNPHYQFWNVGNAILGSIYPKWRMKRDRHDIVRMPAAYIQWLERLDLSPPDPWMMNSGFVNQIAIENDAMLNYYLDAGLPKSKLEVVGAVYDDQLYEFKTKKEQERNDVRQQFDITSSKPFLLIGGCPNQLTTEVPFCEFSNMEEIVKFMAVQLEPLKEHYEIFVRPHPNFPEMGNMFAQYGIHKVEIDTAKMVAISDAYIAFASATIRWAIACAIPVINYDVFHYDYDDFKDVSTVFSANEKGEFKRNLANLNPSTPAFSEICQRAALESTRWGMMDGKCVDRIEAIIDKLIHSPKVPRTAH